MATTGRRCNPALAARRCALMRFAGAAAFLSSPRWARAQQPTGANRASSPKRIVWLDGQGSSPERDAAQKRIREGFKARGLREGEHIALTFQALPPDDVKESDEVADSLVRGRPDAIVLVASALLWSLKKRTRDIPVVFYNLASNPADQGIVESLARPGVNFTGSTQMFDEVVLKDVQLFKQLVPSVDRLGLLVDKEDMELVERHEPALAARQRERWRSLKPRLGIEVVEVPIPARANRNEIALAVSSASVQAVWLGSSSVEAMQYVSSAPVPTKCFSFRRVREGCLFGWSFEWLEGERYAIQAVERILRGDSPAVIPVYQTPINFALNRRRARELGIEIPPSILMSAKQVYE